MENYKEKYEQALERAKYLKENTDGVGAKDVSRCFEEIFPELKESDDEKIRKTLKSFFDSEISDYGNVEWRNGIRYGEIVSWLEKQGEQSHCNGEVNDEALQQQLQIWFNKGKCSGRDEVIFHPENFGLQKQGEQKPTDKVEPKFKVGDWITIDNPCQIISIDGNYIVQYCDDEKTHEISKKFCEFQFHLWTIQDAKDGDVLATKDIVFIFKHMDKTGLSLCKSYCEVIGNSKLGLGFDFSINDVHPATKEQCDLLFQKMKEAGYVWDAEKKELKRRIKQKTTDKVKPKFKVGDTIVEKDLDEYNYETIKDIRDGRYIFTDGYGMNIDEQEGWQLVKTSTIIEQKFTDKVK